MDLLKRSMNLLKRTTVMFMVILMSSVAMYAAEEPVAASYGILKDRVLDNQRNPLPEASFQRHRL